MSRGETELRIIPMMEFTWTRTFKGSIPVGKMFGTEMVLPKDFIKLTNGLKWALVIERLD
jgi:hypothetical protein